MQKSTKRSLFIWEGINQRGQLVNGEQVACSKQQARILLNQRGIYANKIAQKSVRLFSRQRITATDIMLFSRQLATLLNAGIAFIQALTLLANSAEKLAMRLLIEQLRNSIETGTAIATALAAFPHYFNALYCNLVHAGEQSGTLALMFARIATYKEKFAALKAQVLRALIYPSAILIVAYCVSTGLLLFVVPQFATLFQDFGAELPLPTRIVLQVANALQTYGWLIVELSVGSFMAIKFALKKSQVFLQYTEQLIFKIPVIGVILRKAAIVHFTRTLATTFAAGLPILDALRMVAGATGYRLFARETALIREKIIAGQALSTTMQASGLFPSLAVQMIKIGEESGTLEAMLNKVAAIYETEIDNAVANLSSLLEPFIMVMLGLLVGSLVIAMYLPIFKLSSVIH